MRWFKHMSASWSDEKLSDVVDKRGIEGYGFWWRLLEIIAEQTTNTHPPELTYSPQAWASKFKARSDRVSVYFQLFASSDLISFRIVETKWKVSIPNILKFKDEYTERSGHAPKKVNAVSGSKIQIQRESGETVVSPPPISDEKTSSEIYPPHGFSLVSDQPKNGRKPKKQEPRPPGTPDWKWNGWTSLIRLHPGRQFAKGAKDSYFMRVTEERQAAWLLECLKRDEQNNPQYLGGLYTWLESRLTSMEAGLTVEEACHRNAAVKLERGDFSRGRPDPTREASKIVFQHQLEKERGASKC